MISLNNEPCCICGETRSVLAHETAYPEHRYPGSFSLRRCTKCGLLFNSPRLDDRELAELYGRSYYFFARADAKELARIVAMYTRTVAIVADQFAEADRVCLDVGCGRGYFPIVLKRLGWDAHGIEISPDAADYARRRFGLDQIFTGTVEQYVASDRAKQFPLVTAIDVIEHVPRPADFVKALSQVVRPGGVLILDTPNAAAANIRTEGTAWQGFNPFHIYLFTIENLRLLLERYGFTIEQSFSYHNSPASAEHRTFGKRIRRLLVEAARSAGVLGPAAQTYFKLNAITSRNQRDPQSMLLRTLDSIHRAPAFVNTFDARDQLAASTSGDNVVVIARKVP